MNRPVVCALILASLSLVGCRSAIWLGADGMPTNQAQTALEHETKGSAKAGHMTPTHEPVRGNATAKAVEYSRERLDLRYAGIKDNRICFFGTYKHQDAGDGAQPAEVAARYGKDRYIIEARNTLEGLSWPDSNVKSSIDKVEVVDGDTENTSYVNAHGEKQKTAWHEYVLKLCGPAPTFPPDARYMTMMVVLDAATRPPYLLLWIIDKDAPAPQ